MAYSNSNNPSGNNSSIHDAGFKTHQNDIKSEFYELEEAVVLDVIYDETHPEIPNVITTEWPDNYNDKISNLRDKDYSYIGRIQFRMLHSQIGIPKEKLTWAKPLHSTGIVEYPLLNEVVLVANYRSEWYYFRKVNISGFVNNNANFNVEKTEGNTSGNRNIEFSDLYTNVPVNGPISLTGPLSYKTANNRGVLGSYFLANNKIRTVKKFEGDTTLESRHGQSMRFSAYDVNRDNDKSLYADYKTTGYTTNSAYPGKVAGCGNPMILIRNRQRPLGKDKKTTQLHPLLPPISVIPDVEKNTGGIIDEDINNDGTSIHITSGLTISKWKTTVYKTMFSSNIVEEQSKFSPNKATNFISPILTGDQIVINTDRIVMSSRFGETLHFSKKRYGVVTDSEYTIDADDQIIITTNKKTVINSPAIYLGQYDETNEPALLGQTTVDWLYDLCEWLKAHTHWYKHSHPRTGEPSPEQTQLSVQIAQLEMLEARLKPLLSKRVFLTGGGYAVGANGVSPTNTDSNVTPTTINTATGEGVPGGFNGKNSRKLNK